MQLRIRSTTRRYSPSGRIRMRRYSCIADRPGLQTKPRGFTFVEFTANAEAGCYQAYAIASTWIISGRHLYYGLGITKQG